MFMISKMTKNLQNEYFSKQIPVFIILFIAIFQNNRILADEQKGLFIHISLCVHYSFMCAVQIRVCLTINEI